MTYEFDIISMKRGLDMSNSDFVCFSLIALQCLRLSVPLDVISFGISVPLHSSVYIRVCKCVKFE